MANNTNRFGYIYGASNDYKFYMKRKRMQKEFWEIKGVSWSYQPRVLVRKGFGRTQTIIVEHIVTGTLHLWPWNYMPGIDMIFYHDDTYFEPESDAKHYQNTNPGDTETYTTDAKLIGQYVDRGHGKLYTDNYLQFWIERTQTDASDPNKFPFDVTILDRIRFTNVTENVNFGDVPPIDLKFTSYARPFTEYASQAIGGAP